MSETNNTSIDIIYALEDKPGFSKSCIAGIQHVMACFVGIITPTLIIGGALGLEQEIPYLISMALFVSGVSTFIQAKRIGPIGSGLIAVQGTSFAFISALLIAGFLVKERGGSNADILAMMFGVCFWGALVEVLLSQFVHKLKRVITPLTTGVVITTIGISLIKVGMTDLAGGYGSEDFASMDNILLGMTVLIVVLVLNASRFPMIRLSAILIGMLCGFCLAAYQGILSFDHLNDMPLVAIPQPFKYGFAFDFSIFLPVALVYFLSALETAGDLTANCLFCRLPIKGKSYYDRIKGGILGDGVNSMLAATFNTFPNTTFGQNNAVIQMTGVASRHVGFYVAAMLVLLGLFPYIGGVLQAMPKPVLGGATLVMFATIAVGGVKILSSEPIDRRSTLIIATSLGFGLGTMAVPDVVSQMPLWVQNILSSPVTVGGFTAILLSLLLPTNDSVNHGESSK